MDIYIFFVVVLFVLAISDLIVGVSNDAVNFLVSAIGSKAAPFWVIMLIASLGVVVGATFSSGMMEVARKGIFHPSLLSFDEIMIIFMAVMLTDILLLDIFNTFGMPTSTTVSIVFELLGGAVAVALLKVMKDPSMMVGDYINSSKALAIISGILLSVIVAFTVGAIVQYLTRLLFTFKTHKTLLYFGGLWGGIAVTAITYFILIKGLKGSSFASYELANGETMYDYVKHHTEGILLVSFAVWTILLQLVHWLFKVNILKIVVLAGTFALAMAFAGNDLVNFIGVPLAGLRSFEAWSASGVNPSDFSMNVLAAKVGTPTLYLLFAGAIMVFALVFSKKSRSVTKTSLDLSRQDEGSERFGSSLLSRSIVRASISIGDSLRFVVPNRVVAAIDKRFERVEQEVKSGEVAAEFDLIRASVNLMVASILISFATSLKLPLSTTYVTFMVAMGTSLADGAWGRESAVYRITGVISVIGGWFITAFVAFSVAFLVAMFISWGGVYAVIAVLAIVIFMLYKSRVIHKQNSEEETEKRLVDELDENNSTESIINSCTRGISNSLEVAPEIFEKALAGFFDQDRKELKKQAKSAEKFNKRVKKQKDEFYKVVSKLQQDSIETGHYYVQVLDYQREIGHCLTYLTAPLFEHVENNHKGFIDVQIEEFTEMSENLRDFFGKMANVIVSQNFEKVDGLIDIQAELLKSVEKHRKKQVKRIKNKEVGTRNSMLYLNLMVEVRNLLLYSINMVKAHRDFIQVSMS